MMPYITQKPSLEAALKGHIGTDDFEGVYYDFLNWAKSIFPKEDRDYQRYQGEREFWKDWGRSLEHQIFDTSPIFWLSLLMCCSWW